MSEQEYKNLENRFIEFQKHFLEYEMRDELKHKQNEREHQEMMKSFKPVGDWFEKMTVGKNLQISWLKIGGMVVGILVGLMAILTGIYQFFKFIFKL